MKLKLHIDRENCQIMVKSLLQDFIDYVNIKLTIDRKKVKIWTANVYNLLPGGGQFSKYLSNIITFFCYVIRTG